MGVSFNFVYPFFFVVVYSEIFAFPNSHKLGFVGRKQVIDGSI